MIYQVQLLLKTNHLLRRYLREHSWYYKDLVRNPLFVKELMNLMKKEYQLTFPDRLTKITNEMHLLNSVMDVLN